jgi:polyribonucleotide 5'-hydroxyl-kinase
MAASHTNSLPDPEEGVTRHTLKAEEELRLEVGFFKHAVTTIVLREGSAELFGVELAPSHTYDFHGGGLNLPIFTWHGATVDVKCDRLEIAYISDETGTNIATVNTHAQLEALRDDAVQSRGIGPRVMVVGPSEAGKSSLCKILTAYAVKLGRTPLLMDLDVSDNCLSPPGSISVCAVDAESVTIETQATTGVPVTSQPPLVMWHGTTELQPQLFEVQVTALAEKVAKRFENDEATRTAGLIVNTSGQMDKDLDLLVATIRTLQISVVLVLGQDRLYSLLRPRLPDSKQQQQQPDSACKIIKLPRSGGVVNRDEAFVRAMRSRSISRYFYGGLKPNSKVPLLTPFAIHVAIDRLVLYKLTAMQLAASLLPVAAMQTTDPIQLVKVDGSDDIAAALTEKSVLAVCHPAAVAAFKASGVAKDLYASGVAGFVLVEKKVDDTNVRLLSPCVGEMPSHTLLLADNITWMD